MSSDDTTRLSEREQEILLLVARSATNQQIAQDLGISIHTVKVHLRNIFGKIGVSSRTEAAIYALQQGFVQPADSQLSETETGTATSGEAPVATPHTEAAFSETPPAHSHLPHTNAPEASASHTSATPTQSKVLIIGLTIVCVLLAGVLAYVLLGQTARTPSTSGASNMTADAGTPDSVPSDIPGPANPSPPSGIDTLAPMLQPLRHFAVAVYSVDDQIYVIGGLSGSAINSAVTRYDPNTNLWVELSAKPTPVSHVHAETLRGRIYIPGGEDSDGTVLDTFEAFDPRTQQWEKLPSLPAPRSRYALASAEGRLYLFGGWDGETYRTETFIYDLSLDEWLEGPPLPTPRRYAAASSIDDRIYVVGGEDESGSLRTVEHYDPTREELGIWTPAAPLPTPLANPAVASIINTLLVLHPEQHTLFSYTPQSDAWIQRHLPASIDVSSKMVALDTRLYLFGAPDADKPGTLTLYHVDLQTYHTFIPSITNP